MKILIRLFAAFVGFILTIYAGVLYVLLLMYQFFLKEIDK